jgi:SAM-dependent methyltransferase
LRAYENDYVQNLDLAGKGIDLGAKSSDSKYYEYMDMSRVETMEFVDYFHSGQGIIKMDLEEIFPIDAGQYDFVLAFNVMEHLYNYQQFLAEAHRILNLNGRLHGFVPLMWHFHPDPHDYFRFTVQGLERVMEDAGFRDIQVVPLAAGRFKVAAQVIAPIVPFTLLKLPIMTSGVWLDELLAKFSRGNSAYALGYYFSGEK